MSRFIVAALSTLTMLFLGITALQYKSEQIAAEGLTGQAAEAANLTQNVSADAMTVTGNAMPQLVFVTILVVLVVMLMLIRGR